MHTFIAIIFVAGLLILLGRAIGSARAGSWAGPQTPAMRTRAASPRPAAKGRGKAVLRSAGTAAGSAGSAVLHPSNSGIRAQAKADAHRLWTEAHATDWLEERRHARQNGTPAPGTAPGSGGTATATRPTLRQRLRLVPFVAQPASPASGGSNGNGGKPQPAPPNGSQTANGNGGPPARPVPPPAPAPSGSNRRGTTQMSMCCPGHLGACNCKIGCACSCMGCRCGYRPVREGVPSPASSTNGGTNMAAGTSTAGAEQFIEGVNHIHATAASGGINAKQSGIKSATEGCIRFGAMVVMLARQMSEAGRYGPEITEPLAKTAQHLQAAAMTLGEADTAITTLKHMQVGELAASARQAPHHDELNEAGNR